MNFKKEAVKLLNNEINFLEVNEIGNMMETPPDPTMGDIAFPCFKLAQEFKKAPNMIAEELANKLDSDFFEEIKAYGPYLNFKNNQFIFTKSILESVLEKKEKFGYSNVGENKNVVIEYSSPNIAKPFHIGHLRTTMIGNALDNIYKAIGYNTIAINHLGDYGKQFGLLIVAYKKWGDKEALEQEPINELLRLYIKINNAIEDDKELDEQAREWFKKLENDDPEAVRIWKWFKELSLKEFNRIYDMLGVEFDSLAGESFYSDKMPAVLEELRQKNIVKKDNGAEIIDFEDYGVSLPTALITKTDGSSLYITRDIAAAIYRKKEYNFEKNIYVVGSEQKLHFKQWIEILKLMGRDWAEDCVHIPYGLIDLKDGKMSTRKGNILKLDDVLNKSVEKTIDIIDAKNPNLENKEEVAKQVGIGAIIFQDLFNRRIKNYTFSWEQTLSFEGESGPYVQYTHARASSLLDKSDLNFKDNVNYNLINTETEMHLINLLSKYEDVIKKAAEDFEPYHVTRYTIDLAQAFNKFYHDYSILDVDDELSKSRLLLVYSVKTVLKSALNLIGVEAPNKM